MAAVAAARSRLVGERSRQVRMVFKGFFSIFTLKDASGLVGVLGSGASLVLGYYLVQAGYRFSSEVCFGLLMGVLQEMGGMT